MTTADVLQTSTTAPNVECGTTDAGVRSVLFKGTATAAAYPYIKGDDYISDTMLEIVGGKKASTDASPHQIVIYPTDAAHPDGIDVVVNEGNLKIKQFDPAVYIVKQGVQPVSKEIISGHNQHTVGETSFTTDASGYIWVNHGAGFTPDDVAFHVRTPSGGQTSLPTQPMVDQIGATTFRVRLSNVTSATSVTVMYSCFQ
jgi:hypothetical protein